MCTQACFLSVVRPERHICTRSDFVEVTAQEGTLANVVTYDTSCGGHRSPWLIKARPGQRINITMWDFTYHDQQDGVRGMRYNLQCVS